ncbi:MAG: YqgE/AlgH family protein [Flavobacteriia bacterium]|jgi:putative transcriptional regulator
MSNKVPDISFTNKLLPKKGRILLSDPFMGDEYFERSVVYLCEHSKEGSFGFVMNHDFEVNLKELNDNFPDMNTKISVGGPVEKETLYFMHSMGDELNDSLQISEGIYMGGDFEQLYKIITPEIIAEDKVRFFLGYSGWSANQLQQEIKDHAWIVCDIDNFQEILTTQEVDMWKYFMNKLGPKYKLISDFPLDPSEN